jgi:20S proteasome alpha/beta subunit
MAAIDFTNPMTWHEEMSDEDALNLAIFAMNTIAHPEGSDDHSVAVLDHFSDAAIARLCDLRERLED